MKIDEAVRWHSTLAEALVGVWTSAPGLHPVLHNLLGEWESNAATSQAAFLEGATAHFKTRNIPSAVVQAVDAAKVDGYDALDGMFAKLVDKVRVEYQAIDSSWGAGQGVKLIKLAQTDRVFPDTAPYGGLGATACVPPEPDSAGLPFKIVKVTFVPALLGPATWASVPSLLCHELIAHINQAAPMESGDSFGEGRMDVVAGLYHKAWISDLFPQCREFAMRSANELRALTNQQNPEINQIDHKTRAVRSKGTEAAQQVLGQVIAQVDEAGRTPNREFERLSLQLNRVHARANAGCVCPGAWRSGPDGDQLAAQGGAAGPGLRPNDVTPTGV